MSKKNIEKVLLMNELELVYNKCEPEDIIEYYQDKILELGDVELAYWFATRLPNCDIRKIGKIIIDSKDVKYNYDFPRNVKGADVKAHGEVILESKYLYHNYNFALTVPGADIKAHQQIILDSKDPYYNCLFASSIPGIDTTAHEQILFERNDLYYIYVYATMLKVDNLENYSTEKVLNFILQSNNEVIIKKFYKERPILLEKTNKKKEFEEFLMQRSNVKKKIYKYGD